MLFNVLMNGEVMVILLVDRNGDFVPNPNVSPWWQWEVSHELGGGGGGIALTFCDDEPMA